MEKTTHQSSVLYLTDHCGFVAYSERINPKLKALSPLIFSLGFVRRMLGFSLVSYGMKGSEMYST